ncbi:hypothetical protein GRF61_20625 [Azoarcus sp. TTM-91]|uniref:DUF637 domain-containing protein n=1 Tax=Azoarcus sp. TTM-91 TaxID=2691581 RepID=UPI00145E513E|nr:hypothetical protein [Azoarcus sp. TTM-91]
MGSRVEAGGNLTLESGEDQRYQVAKLSSGADLTLDAGGDISFEGVKDLKQESHEKSSSNWAWTSAKGKGRTDETLRQSELVAAGNLVIEAAGKIRIDIPEVNAQTVTQTIDALVEAEPKLAWLKEMESRGDIDWQRVKEVHDQWKYSHSGMGAGLAIIVAIVIAIVTYGAASGAIGTAATTTTTTAAGAGAAAGTASTASAWAVGGWANAAASASLAGMASNTAVQLGTTGKVDWGQVLKTGAVSAITAGVSNYGFFEGGQSLNSLAGLSAAPGAAGSTTATSGLSFSWDQVYGVMGRGVVNASVSSAIQGTDFKDGFINSVVGDYAALGANSIGSLWGNGQNPVMQTLAHAALGAGAAGLTGRDAVAGAIGGLVESGLDNTLGQSLRESGTELGKWDKLAYMVAAMVAGGVAAEAVGHDGVTAAQTAQNAAVNNYLTALQLAQVEEARHQCAGDALCEAQVIESAQNLSRKQDFELTIAKIMCAVGTCERLDFMTSAIDQGNDPVSVQQYLQERYQNLPADVVAGAVDYYRAGALESLEDSTWNVVDSTLHFSGAVGAITGPLAVGAKATKEFGSEALLLSHFEKHGAEFGAKNVDEYMQIGRDIMQNGQKVEYLYKGEIRTGFVQFMGNRASGQAKFGFVGTNADGAITTIHVESGNSFWKLMSGSYLEKIIYPK